MYKNTLRNLSAYKYRADNGGLYCPTGAKCFYSSGISITSSQVSGGGRLTRYEGRYSFSYPQASGAIKSDFLSEIFSVQQNDNYDPKTPIFICRRQLVKKVLQIFVDGNSVGGYTEFAKINS
jgi:hypothetical protein